MKYLISIVKNKILKNINTIIIDNKVFSSYIIKVKEDKYIDNT
ncbi:hypothetical protein CBC_A0153 [Clostridium botulinum C str. Eklund]|nr:hypothetical protein CBC_A0153 [Clostridium botulinum C str. Eklund]